MAVVLDPAILWIVYSLVLRNIVDLIVFLVCLPRYLEGFLPVNRRRYPTASKM